MNKAQFKEIENIMLTYMKDSAHDKEHIYRVLYTCIKLAKDEENVDYDVLIAAAMLHDIGRQAQFENPSICHAQVGADMAEKILENMDWEKEKIKKVKDAIKCHRYRKAMMPSYIEGKILFDSDKLDSMGALGIVRTVFYNGKLNEPLYVMEDGKIIDDGPLGTKTFFGEYKYKLSKIGDSFLTESGRKMAEKKKNTAENFYRELYGEVNGAYDSKSYFQSILQEEK